MHGLQTCLALPGSQVPDTVYTPKLQVAEMSPEYPSLQVPGHDAPLWVVPQVKLPLPTVTDPLQEAAIGWQ